MSYPFLQMPSPQVFQVGGGRKLRGYAFGVIHHQAYLTHIECEGTMLIINPTGLILTKGLHKTGGLSLPVVCLQEKFSSLLNRKARERYSSYYIVGKEDKEILRTLDGTDSQRVLKAIREEAKNRR